MAAGAALHMMYFFLLALLLFPYLCNSSNDHDNELYNFKEGQLHLPQETEENEQDFINEGRYKDSEEHLGDFVQDPDHYIDNDQGNKFPEKEPNADTHAELRVDETHQNNKVHQEELKKTNSQQHKNEEVKAVNSFSEQTKEHSVNPQTKEHSVNPQIVKDEIPQSEQPHQTLPTLRPPRPAPTLIALTKPKRQQQKQQHPKQQQQQENKQSVSNNENQQYKEETTNRPSPDNRINAENKVETIDVQEQTSMVDKEIEQESKPISEQPGILNKLRKSDEKLNSQANTELVPSPSEYIPTDRDDEMNSQQTVSVSQSEKLKTTSEESNEASLKQGESIKQVQQTQARVQTSTKLKTDFKHTETLKVQTLHSVTHDVSEEKLHMSANQANTIKETSKSTVDNKDTIKQEQKDQKKQDDQTNINVRLSPVSDPDPKINSILQSANFVNVRKEQISDYISSHFKGQELQDDVLDMIDSLITSNLKNEIKQPNSRLNRILNDVDSIDEKHQDEKTVSETDVEDIGDTVSVTEKPGLNQQSQTIGIHASSTQTVAETVSSNSIEIKVQPTPVVESLKTQDQENPSTQPEPSSFNTLHTEITEETKMVDVEPTVSIQRTATSIVPTVADQMSSEKVAEAIKLKRKNFMKQALKGVHGNHHHSHFHHTNNPHSDVSSSETHKHSLESSSDNVNLDDTKHQIHSKKVDSKEEGQPHVQESEKIQKPFIEQESKVVVQEEDTTKPESTSADEKRLADVLSVESHEEGNNEESVDNKSEPSEDRETLEEKQETVKETEENNDAEKEETEIPSESSESGFLGGLFNYFSSESTDETSDETAPKETETTNSIPPTTGSINSVTTDTSFEEELVNTVNEAPATPSPIVKTTSTEHKDPEPNSVEDILASIQPNEVAMETDRNEQIQKEEVSSSAENTETQADSNESVKSTSAENSRSHVTKTIQEKLSEINNNENVDMEHETSKYTDAEQEKHQKTVKPTQQVKKQPESHKHFRQSNDPSTKPSVKNVEQTKPIATPVARVLDETEPKTTSLPKKADAEEPKSTVFPKEVVESDVKEKYSSIYINKAPDEDNAKTKQEHKKNADSTDEKKRLEDIIKSKISEDDPLYKLCLQHPGLSACQKMIKSTTPPLEQDTKVEGSSSSAAGYIKKFTRWVNGCFYFVYIYIVSCIKALVIVIWSYTIGILLSITGQQELSQVVLDHLNSFSNEKFGLLVIFIVNHIVFYWYFKNSTMGPTVRIIKRIADPTNTPVAAPIVDETKIIELNKQIKQLNEEFQKETTEKVELEEKVSKHIKEVEDLQSIIKELKGLLSETETDKATIVKLREESEESQNILTAKETELRISNTTLDSIKEDLDTQKTDYKQLEEKFYYVIKELDTKDVAIGKMEENEKELNQQIDEKEKTINEKDETIFDQKTRIGLLLEEKIQLEDNVEDIRKQCHEYEVEIQVLQESLLAINRISLDHETSSEFDNVEEDTEIDAEQLKAERLSKIIDATKALAELKEVRAELALNQHELEKYTTVAHETQEKYLDLTNKYDETSLEAVELRKSLEKKEIELMTIQKFFGDRETDYQKSSVSLNEEIKFLKKQIDSIGDNDKQISILLKQIEELKNEIENNEKQYKQQLSTAEEQSHNNYIKMRTAIRECDEHKREKEIYRKRLLDIDMTPKFKTTKSSTPISKALSDRISDRASSPTNSNLSNKSMDDSNGGTESPRPQLPGPAPPPFAPRMYPGMPPPFRPPPPFGMPPPMGPYGGHPRPPLYMSPMNQPRFSGSPAVQPQPASSAYGTPTSSTMGQPPRMTDQRPPLPMMQPLGSVPPHMGSPMRQPGMYGAPPPGTSPMARPPPHMQHMYNGATQTPHQTQLTQQPQFSQQQQHTPKSSQNGGQV